MTTTIVPASGSGILATQQGVGTTPGYSAIDLRRFATCALSPGPLGSASVGAYTVAQRGAGANMSVDIAASTGSGLAIAGTTIANQGVYLIPPHASVINEVIAASDPSNPRVDQIVVQCLDNVVDGSAGNRAQTIVLTGTPTAGATIGIGGNRNGAAALPASSYRLADVLVPATSTTVTNANIFDRRPKTRGHCNIATSEVRSAAGYGTMPTPDQVTELVLPTDGLIAVAYQAIWTSNSSGNQRAAIFLGANQLQTVGVGAASPAIQEAVTSATTAQLLVTTGQQGLTNPGNGTGYTGDVTTGQTVGQGANAGPSWVFAAAGTYHVSVQFKASAGQITVASRKLLVWTMAPDQAILA